MKSINSVNVVDSLGAQVVQLRTILSGTIMNVSKDAAANPKTGCPIETSISVIGGVWKPLILFTLLEGTKRFGEISRAVPKATQRILTLQLRELEADGVVKRTVYAEVPLRVEYELTEVGHSLEALLRALHAWGSAYNDQQSL